MPSNLQVVVFIILLFVTIFAFGWQTHKIWVEDIQPVVKGEGNGEGN